MKYFEFVDRTRTDSIKWHPEGMLHMASYADKDSIPVWVADMDFKTVPGAIQALKNRIDHGVYGYSMALPEYYQAIQWWYRKRFSWDIPKEAILSTPGIVPALAYIINAFTQEGEGVIIQEPVYYPFKNHINFNKRRVVNSPLVETDGIYTMDFNDLQKKAGDPNVKLMILCSPHNPVGRVWTEEDLLRVAEICLKNGVLLVADEIHSDLMLFGSKFHSCGTLPENLLQNIIVCTAPSKTFNLAALHVSNLIILNPSILARLKQFMERICVSGEPSMLGAVAVQSVYTPEGEGWLSELISVLESNYTFMKTYLERNIPKIKMHRHEGTYLCWLDFRETGLTAEEIAFKMEREAKIVTDGGPKFGESGAGFMRFNIACHRSTLEQVMERLKKTFA